MPGDVARVWREELAELEARIKRLSPEVRRLKAEEKELGARTFERYMAEFRELIAEARRRGHSWPDVYEWSPDSMPEGATVDDGTAYVLACGVWGRDPDLRAVTDELRERESELKQAKKERKALKSLLG